MLRSERARRGVPGGGGGMAVPLRVCLFLLPFREQVCSTIPQSHTHQDIPALQHTETSES